MSSLELGGFIRNISYFPKFKDNRALKTYELCDFDVNQSSSFGRIKLSADDFVVYSKWITPKRTRSYPFSRLYEIYSSNTKVITIIPIIKDEGADSANNDRINAITFSWMNLLNIYIVLAYYDNAERKQIGSRGIAANLKRKRALKTEYITNQKLNNKGVVDKIREISNYKMTALHWNTKHFEDDFEDIWKQSVKAYSKISRKLNVRLHDSNKHMERLESFKVNNKFSLDRFKEVTNITSKGAQKREILTTHQLESLGRGVKARINISNYLGGLYYLTCDEVYTEGGKLIIQESKNSSKDFLPDKSSIKDGLFKLMLFTNLAELKFNEVPVEFTTRLKLTGKFNGRVNLPIEEEKLLFFLEQNHVNEKYREMLRKLNEESKRNNISIIIRSNSE